QIVVQGDPNHVMTPEHVHDVFGLQTQVIADPITNTPMCIPIGRRERAIINQRKLSEQTVA
ncbi:MAG: cobalamin/Fe(3+)-siderophore ABC transporter ATP-binding protein, partial [Chloroflexota bacterium]